MRERCRSPRNKAWAYYGGRGIDVCERWFASFEAFIADMGRRPSDGHSIDRINNDGHYEPGNCRWATRSEQARNKRASRRRPRGTVIEYGGEVHGQAEWARILGWPRHTIANRLKRGWPTERIFSTPA